MTYDDLIVCTYEDQLFNVSFDYYEVEPVNKAIEELREKYELAVATIKEYKNDIANLNEKLDEANMRADLAEAANTEYHIDIQNLQKRIEELT